MDTDILYLSIRTTGPSAARDRIIEIGAIFRGREFTAPVSPGYSGAFGGKPSIRSGPLRAAMEGLLELTHGEKVLLACEDGFRDPGLIRSAMEEEYGDPNAMGIVGIFDVPTLARQALGVEIGADGSLSRCGLPSPANDSAIEHARSLREVHWAISSMLPQPQDIRLAQAAKKDPEVACAEMSNSDLMEASKSRFPPPSLDAATVIAELVKRSGAGKLNVFDEIARPIDEAVARFLTATAGARAVRLRAAADIRQYVIIAPDPVKSGGWRATRFDQEGPSGHTEFSSLENAVRSYAGGFAEGPACGSPGEFLIESVCIPDSPEAPRNANPQRERAERRDQAPGGRSEAAAIREIEDSAETKAIKDLEAELSAIREIEDSAETKAVRELEGRLCGGSAPPPPSVV